MWEELKAKLPKKVEWSSDGESGVGSLVEMEVTEHFIEFTIEDPMHGRFTMGSARDFVGVTPAQNTLRISAIYMGEIVLLPDKGGEDGR